MVSDDKKKVEESVDQNNVEKNDDKTDNLKNRDSEWMLRACRVYKEEYDDCTSFRGRFQQNFVYGEKLDCSQWKTDYDNCKKWKKTDDDDAYTELVASEKKRRLERLRPHYQNNVWEKREEPPKDWNAPLPDYLVQRNNNTFLALKQADIENNRETSDMLIPGCVIL
ncbi:hypothetical protein HCN44_007086 [Aphidius gifuensis]|uniref:Synaptic plasticity regulator PANTS n=1 Tax=Aphidius gifuensis TaxID=684658 RepID=A0A834XMM8_APHGI|nr:UPF0545 protein C22orf39 homolog [Aphidius gifuensis]KAF7988776.1 hypothetical protein HCN44_007086 [Aphidius gifuensis]